MNYLLKQPNLPERGFRVSDRGEWTKQERMIEKSKKSGKGVVGKAFDEELSPNTQPMHDGKSSGSHGLQIDFCYRTWGYVVSGVCGD